MKTMLFASMLGFLVQFALPASAQMVQIDHAAASFFQQSNQGEINRVWKIHQTSMGGGVIAGVGEYSEFGQGFVVHVSEPLSLSPMANVGKYAWSEASFKAVYLLTNAHVFFGERDDAQKQLSRVNQAYPNQLFSILTRFTFREPGWQSVHTLETLPNKYMWNIVDGVRVPFDTESMGMKVIRYCYDDSSFLFPEDGLRLRAGCDFALVRILVPASVQVPTYKISLKPPRNGRNIFFPVREGKGLQKVSKVFKNSDGKPWLIYSRQEGKTYIAGHGNSGSPMIDADSQEAIGILFASWPGVSSSIASYSLGHVYENLDVLTKINEDLSLIRQQGRAPLRSFFWRD